MAVTESAVLIASTPTDATSFSTASWTPTANVLLLATVAVRGNASPNIPTASGNGLTWVVAVSEKRTGSGRITTFRSLGAAPSAGALTFDFGGQTQANAIWSIVEYAGTDTTGTFGSGAIVQSAVDDSSSNVTTLTATLAAFADAGNATFGGAWWKDQATLTAGSGFAITHQKTETSFNAAMGIEWRNDNDTTVDFTSSISAQCIVVGVEIKAGAAAGGSLIYPVQPLIAMIGR